MSVAARLVTSVLAAGLYGFAIGSVHSWTYAWHNLIKFPLLLAVTAGVCAGAYFLAAKALAPSLRFLEVARLVAASYFDTAALLASLGTVVLLFAIVFDRPTSLSDLGEYPLFLGLNVIAIGICGSLALVRQGSHLLSQHRLSRGRATTLVGAWLGLSLTVGAQWSWYLRPFFGNRAAPDDGAFCLGTEPDFRGARSFYEAVAQLLVPPAPSCSSLRAAEGCKPR